MFDLPAFIELFGSFDTRREKEIFLSLDTWGCAEEEPYLIFSHRIDIPVDSIMRLPRDNTPWHHEDTPDNYKDDEKFAHPNIKN
jgi:hypothetical protein